MLAGIGGSFALEVSNLGRRFGHQWVLSGCRFQVPFGDCLGLVGANGVGKTTLLRILVGQLSPTLGEASVLGAPPGSSSARQGVAYLAQHKPLFPDFTVDDMVRFGRHMNRGWCEAVARQRLEDCGIPQRKRVRQLSGGQRAELALALTLAKAARLVLLDEPQNDLDPVARERLLSTLRELSHEGTTLVVSSHALSDLADICNAYVLLRAGSATYYSASQLGGTAEAVKTRVLQLMTSVERATLA